MANKGVLSKNYYIDSVVVTDFGTNIYNMMAEADQAMAEASEIIADIASLTERVPSHIRCNDLLEACASAQAEIKSVDFLSYGQKVDQGLQNLLDHNQYITEHFIKNMEGHTEKMRGLGEEFRRLSELITYSGESMPLKGIAFSAVSNAEVENTDGEKEKDSVHSTEDLPCWGAAEVLEVSAEEIMAQEENASNQGLDDPFICVGAAEVLEINTEEVMIKSGAIILSNYMIAYGLGDKYEINKFIKWISVRRPDLLQQLCAANLSSAEEAEQVLDEIFNEIVVAQNGRMKGLYDKYNLIITVEDVGTLKFTENNISFFLNDVQKETFVACWNMLVGMGYSREQIIGIMANLYEEGKYSPTNVEDGKTDLCGNFYRYGVIDDSLVYKYECKDNIGYGICQWTYFQRKIWLQDMAKAMQGSESDLDVQLAYLRWELENWKTINPSDGNYFIEDFMKLDTVEDATIEFMNHFENPAPGSEQRRKDYATNISDWYDTIQ